LVSSADSHATFSCEAKQNLDFSMSLGQRLLDVQVSPGEQGTTGRLEVRSGGGAHVYDVRLRLLQQLVERSVRPPAGEPRELLSHRKIHIVDRKDGMRTGHPPECLQVKARHPAGPNERHPQLTGAARRIY